MQRVIESWHSPSLNKPMEIVTYGYYGFPLLMFPTAAADYLEYERFYVIDAIKDPIESGKVKVFSINSLSFFLFDSVMLVSVKINCIRIN